MAPPSSPADQGINPLLIPLVNQIHQRCTLPTATQLKDEISCHICHEIFFTGANPEIALKLPCGHILGIKCLSPWLAPLSEHPEETQDSCPTCRQTVLGELLPETNIMQDRRMWVERFDDFRIDSPFNVAQRANIDPWKARTECLWVDLRENLVAGFEESQADEHELYDQLREVTYVIGFVSLYEFIRHHSSTERNLSTPPRFYDVFYTNIPRALGPYVSLCCHLEVLRHMISGTPWDEARFLVPIDDDYVRASRYHQRIIEARARMSYRLHAALEPDEAGAARA